MVVERYARAIQDKDFDAQDALLTDDFIDEMPQSGERREARPTISLWSATTRAAWEPWNRRVPGWSEPRTAGFSRQCLPSSGIEGSGDVYTYVGSVRYPNGETWQMIAIIELRNGQVAKSTTSYAAPFDAPEWRAPYVERFTPDAG